MGPNPLTIETFFSHPRFPLSTLARKEEMPMQKEEKDEGLHP